MRKSNKVIKMNKRNITRKNNNNNTANINDKQNKMEITAADKKAKASIYYIMRAAHHCSCQSGRE